MAKRGASTDINHDNWDDPYEVEEAGSFKPASREVLQNRVLKVARRSLKPSNNAESGKSVFASFSGFKPAAVPPAGNKFLGGVSSSSVSTTTSTAAGTQYLADLQELNRSVCNWIKTHVDSNPLCILTPVFKDYDMHLKKIQEDRDAKGKSDSAASSSVPSFNFVSSSTNDSNKFTINVPSADNVKKTFSFADTSDTNKSSPSIFGDGKSPLTRESDKSKPVNSVFSTIKDDTSGVNLLSKPDPATLMSNPFISVLDKAPPLNGSTPTSTNKDEDDENESDEPPKVEFKPIEEEGSVFSTRCKVFVKKDDNYKDRGVGTLFIKKVGEEKYQLLVRAETVLGNILVNILLTASIPTKRMGKNNVMLVCIPTPQDLPPPTTVLLRVKTSDDADNLLTTLEKFKQ